MDHFEHSQPSNLGQALIDSENAYIKECLTAIELMVIQMDYLLDVDERVSLVILDRDDSNDDQWPEISCLDGNDEEIQHDIPDAVSFSEIWRNSFHAGVNHFLSHAYELIISRENRTQDRKSIIDHMAQSLPLSDEKQKEWAHSFNSFLVRRDLLRKANIDKDTLVQAVKSTRKPGM